MQEQLAAQSAKPGLKPAPDQPDPLAQQWQKRVAAASTKLEKFHKRVVHNRRLVAGFDWSKDPASKDFYNLRANLIHGTITAILPNIYARNPEISVTPAHQGRDLKLLCKTIEQVTNRQLTDAKLKKRAKATVRAALTCSFGGIKAMYQRDLKTDPFIKARIQDTQDNIAHIEQLIAQIDDPVQRADQELAKAELEEALAGLHEHAEVVAGEGMVLDRLLTEHIIIDPSVAEFDDYVDGDFMVQKIPMRKSYAEGVYGYCLDGAKTYKQPGDGHGNSGGMYSGGTDKGADDQICILEIWDKTSQRVFTTAEGINYWLKEPFTPEAVGERWYPFFLLPYQLVDGTVIAPSLVDLTEKLQAEHNETRDKEHRHRQAIRPGWIGDRGTLTQKDLEALRDAGENEITLLDAGGKPINQAVMPKTYAAIDQTLYDTSKVRYDWEQVSGMQDAARSSVVQPKTATEASIMQQSLSGRVSEFRDQVEDFLQEIAQYTAQILLLELTPAQVERIMGPNKMGPILGPDGQPVIDPGTGQPVMGVVEAAYDWPQLSRDEVFDMVQLQIRAGTTGEPDKLDQQEVWLKMLPAVQPLITQIMQLQMQGVDTSPLEALLRETVTRFDDKIDLDTIMPKPKPKQVAPAAPSPVPQASPLQPQPQAA
jgi:hypothetical protein